MAHRVSTLPPPSPVPPLRRRQGTIGITVYGCEPDEAALFHRLAPHFEVEPTLTDAPPTPTGTDLVAGNRCVSIGHRTPVTNPTLRALRRAGVRYLSTRSIGCNHFDPAYAEEIGLTVGNVSYSPDSVADHTLLLILMALRHVRTMCRRVDLHDYRLAERRGRELRDLTVGVVGVGRIGTAVVERLRGFGCRTLTHDRGPDPDGRHVPLDDLLAESDVVSLHTPLTPATHHLIDERRLDLLGPDALLVNTGRGPLVDTPALVTALETGRLGGAALDVVEGEEGVFYVDHRHDPIGRGLLLRLHRLPNVVLSPHTAYYTDHALRDTVEHTLRNCVSFERGTSSWVD